MASPKFKIFSLRTIRGASRLLDALRRDTTPAVRQHDGTDLLG
jgi:hypothetical protein